MFLAVGEEATERVSSLRPVLLLPTEVGKEVVFKESFGRLDGAGLADDIEE